MRCSWLLSFAFTVMVIGGMSHTAFAKPEEWVVIDKLVENQKLQEAEQRAEKILARAKGSSDDMEWTKALVFIVQMKRSLHSYEDAVRFLKTEPWPRGALAATTLDLYYARLLTTYLASYSWEIRQRELVESKDPVDLKAWTADQIYEKALASFDAAWKRREKLGEQPVKALKDFITPNDYPTGVRPTLRDTITYMAVDLLSDSSNWKPEQTNSVDRLDAIALLDGDRLPEQKSLNDASQHPLARAAGALADLEQWHRSERQSEAALEAHLERGRTLVNATQDVDVKIKLETRLETYLGDKKKLTWWSTGMADLATMYLAREDMVKAHALAVDGMKEHPDSIGGQHCAAIKAQIEVPSFTLESMRADTAGQRSLLVTHNNLTTLYFRAYAVDVFKQIGQAKDYNLLPGYEEMRNLIKTKATATWTAELDNVGDYRSHKTFVIPKLTKKGFYVVLASRRKDFAESANAIVGTNFVLSDLVFVSQSNGKGGLSVTVVEGENGKPAKGVDVKLYKLDYRSKHKVVASALSDANGAVSLFSKEKAGSHIIVGQRGDDLLLNTDTQYLSPPKKGSATDGVFLYTDRGVYRPGQKLFWKAVTYTSNAEQTAFKTAPGASLTVTLHDGNGQVVATEKVKANDFGTASGEIIIPVGRLLGLWTLQSTFGRGGRQQLLVEEYKRPTFEVTLIDPAEALRLNAPAKLKGEAKYYFGQPVSGATVRWNVKRQPVYPWWWGYWYGAPSNQRAETVGNGTSKLSDDGTFAIEFTPEALEKAGKDAKSLSYNYSLTADLTDEGGETRSARRNYRIGFVAVDAAIVKESEFFVEGKPAVLTVMRTSLDGAPRKGSGTYSVFALKQPTTTLAPADMALPTPDDADRKWTPGDKLRPRWTTSYNPEAEMGRWLDGEDKSKGSVTHDDKGQGTVTLPLLAAGAYRLRYSTKDEFGAVFETWKDFVVVSKTPTPLALPAVLMVESTSVSVGKKARIFAQGAFAGQTLFLDTFRAGALIEHRVIDVTKGGLIDIPVTEADRGGFAVRLSGIVDFQLINLTLNILVPWDNKELSIEMATFRDKLKPGAKETFKVTVTGPKASAAAAEVLAYMYDRSLDFFARNNPQRPTSLYPNGAFANQLVFNAGPIWGQPIAGTGDTGIRGYPTLNPDRLIIDDGYGAGGMGRRTYALGNVMTAAPMARATASGMPSKVASAEEPPASALAQDSVMEAKKNTSAPVDQESTAPQPKGTRSNFAETAFFLPQLRTDKSGNVSFEFEVPDSVTSWNLWVVALTKDLSSGVLKKEAVSVKDLMVRPYLPRFFREDDQADIKVVVNNASDATLSGEVILEIHDPETDADLSGVFGLKDKSQSFKVEKNGGTTVTFSVKAPKRVGLASFKVTAKAGNLSDGEIRPLPILPSRMHLAQSRFVALKDKDSRTMTFADLAKNDDASRINESLVVTVDGQLFYGVLNALPYLVNYPYECTEQTLNRFLATGIVSSVYKEFPQVSEMASKSSGRKTPLEAWDRNDPNMRMTLEESPWLVESRGGKVEDNQVVNTLDPASVKRERDVSISKLRQAQTANGAFPWFPGGPPSPYMTLYIVHGFARAVEFGVDVPKPMVTKAWSYLAQHLREDFKNCLANKGCFEYLTLLNYVATSFPDDSWLAGAITAAERQDILDFTFAHWKEHSPYLKAYLALTLNRAGRADDAWKVFDSVMDSAKTDKDLGTYWAPEDRSWLWYNDTIETHAFALRTLMELKPDDKRIDGLVQWLFLNKKLNHWKSTKATAEVIYSLVHYLKKNKSLGVPESVVVSAGSQKATFDFDPKKYAGRAQMVVEGSKVNADTAAISISKESKGLMFASSTWQFSTEKPPTEDRGDFFHASRQFFRRDGQGKEATLKPLKDGDSINVGDQIEVQISLRTKHAAEYVHLRDPRPAGTEPESVTSRYKWDLGISWFEEIRDSGANFFFEQLPVGEYTFKHRLRATTAGTFLAGPATVQSLYAPEFAAYTAASRLIVK